jgi:beta-hydroxylase
LIKDEYIKYNDTHQLLELRNIDEYQKNIDISDKKWYVIYLKCYNKYTDKIKYFPNTYELIKDIPGCILAMLSIIEPNKFIPIHTGIYNGILRYHLTIITDADYNNCFIVINNIKYSWIEGKDILFDDTYEHHVENNTNTTRVVLFLDIEKKFNNLFIKYLNKLVISLLKNNNKINDILIDKTNNIS